MAFLWILWATGRKALAELPSTGSSFQGWDIQLWPFHWGHQSYLLSFLTTPCPLVDISLQQNLKSILSQLTTRPFSFVFCGHFISTITIFGMTARGQSSRLLWTHSPLLGCYTFSAAWWQRYASGAMETQRTKNWLWPWKLGKHHKGDLWDRFWRINKSLPASEGKREDKEF